MENTKTNNVELVGYYGSDEVIACSAWTSTSRQLTDKKRERIGTLIKQLWNDGHETPFEKGIVHFLVDTDIATHIHILKHRLSSMNGESARYKELQEDKYYVPEDWKGIQANTTALFRNLNDGADWADILTQYTNVGNKLYHDCLADLTPVLGRSRAKESARFFKAYNSKIQGDVSFNMRSFANFIALRSSKHAQLEIRNLANQMWTLVQNIQGQPFLHSLDAIESRIKFREKSHN